MPVLLQATNNATGNPVRVVGPTTVFVEGSLGGGTITLSAQREASTSSVSVATVTTTGVVHDGIIGPHYLKASLSGATSPNVTVATP